MSKRTTKFDALAYAVAVLGQPHETGKDRTIEESHGLVAVVHMWRLPCGRWLSVHEWSDGDQSTNGRAGMTYALRNNEDGSLCPEYEAQARELIDAYAEAAK